jgi:hypothetical protein
MPYRISLNHGGASAYMLAYNTGKDGQILFRGRADYEHFIVILKRLNRSTDTVSILGFNVLHDAFYLVLHEDQSGSAAKFIQRLSIAYGIYFNAKYGRTGKVFRGPYKDTLLTTDDQLMQTLCKVHRLPELQHLPAETYEWSSYHYYLHNRGTWLRKTFVEKYFATTSYQHDLRNMTSSVTATRLQ